MRPISKFTLPLATPVGESPRLEVLVALTSALEEITPANGFQFDLSTSVFRGRRYFGDSDPLPMISILEDPIPAENKTSPLSANPSNAYTLKLLIQGFIGLDRSSPESNNESDPAHRLAHNVKVRLAIEKSRAIGNSILGMGGKVTSLSIGTEVVRPPDEGVSSEAYFWLPLEMGIIETICP